MAKFEQCCELILSVNAESIKIIRDNISFHGVGYVWKNSFQGALKTRIDLSPLQSSQANQPPTNIYNILDARTCYKAGGEKAVIQLMEVIDKVINLIDYCLAIQNLDGNDDYGLVDSSSRIGFEQFCQVFLFPCESTFVPIGKLQQRR